MKKYFAIWRQRARFFRLEYFTKLKKSDFATIDSRKIPVVLVAGIYAGGRSLLPMKKFLEKKGWSVSLAPEKKNSESVAVLARKLQKRIRAIPAKKVQIVAHSLGGITVLASLRDPQISKKVERVIALGSPFCGCALGDLAFWEKKNNQKWFARNSGELAKLTAHRKINSKIISLRAEFDEIVFPTKVSTLPGARENSAIKIVGHAGLILAKKSWREIAKKLKK